MSIGGNRLRVKLSNAYGNGPVENKSAHLTRTSGSSPGSSIVSGTDESLTFGASSSVTIAAGLRLYGATILPFNGHSYYTAARETARQTVNDWIRTSGSFDAVIDLDAAVRDPSKTDTLRSSYDSGDHLHLNQAGYQAMANAISLALFGQ